jgi:ribosomal protein L5
MNTRLEKFYKDEVVPALTKKFGYTNPMEVPRLTKITINMGVGEAATNKKILENAVADLTKIAGQKPIVTKSRVSVASFKIRDGWPIGCKVTLPARICLSSLTAWSTSRCRASATSAACRVVRSTAAATTTWA